MPAGRGAQPLAILHSVEPGNCYYRLLRAIEVRIVPERWGWDPRRSAQKIFVLTIGYLAGGEVECVDPDAVQRALVILACVGAHPEPAFGDGNESRFDQQC